MKKILVLMVISSLIMFFVACSPAPADLPIRADQHRANEQVGETAYQPDVGKVESFLGDGERDIEEELTAPEETVVQEEKQPEKKSLIELADDFKDKYRVRELIGLPKYVAVADWVDELHALVQAGSNPLIVNVDSGEYRALNLRSWWVSLSPDKKVMAYATDEGIRLLELDGEQDKLVISRKYEGVDVSTVEGNAPVDGIVWAPSGRKFLTMAVSEWGADYFVYELAGSQLSPVNTEIKDYFLTEPVGWLDDQRIIFLARANRKRDGTQEYTMGYRQDLAVANLESGTFELVTNVDDGTFFKNVNILGDGSILYREQLENELGEILAVKWAIRDLGNGEEETLNFPGNAEGIYINHALGTFSFLMAGSEVSEGNKQQLIGNEQEKTILEVFSGTHFSGLKWSPDGSRAAISVSAAVPAQGTEEYSFYLLEPLAF